MAADLFANNASTTLAALVAAGATSLTVTSSTPFPAASAATGQFRVIIDSELFTVTNVAGTTWTVTPGTEGTTQAAHASGAPVTAIVTAAALATKVTSAQAAAAAPVQTVAGRTGAVVLTSADISGLATGQTVVTKRGPYMATAGDYVLADTSSRSVADGATNTNTTVTSATAAFTAADVGRLITGGTIPAGATITVVGSATSVTISAPATATATAVTLVIGGSFTVTIPVLTTTQRVSVKSIGAGTVTVAATSGTVDGVATVALSAQYIARDLVGDGTNLWIA